MGLHLYGEQRWKQIWNESKYLEINSLSFPNVLVLQDFGAVFSGDKGK